MNNENSSIHDFDFELIAEYFSRYERQGPGSPEVTLKALSFIDNLKESSEILDIGCGTGTQTLILAENSPGFFTGLDLFPGFIDLFTRNARMKGLDNRAKGMLGDMTSLPFENRSFDLIWSEGAIYNIGFERGLKEWREFLKPGGYLAVSDATWFANERPEEIENFWKDAYPGIDILSSRISQMEKEGYLPVASFILPEACWTTHFYEPQVQGRKDFLEKYPDNPAVKIFLENEEREAELYAKYKDYYGYVFYIGKKYR